MPVCLLEEGLLETEYLGVQLGPTTTNDERWAAATARFDTRVSAEAQAGVAPSIGLHYLRTHASPAQGNVGQFVKPTPRVLAKHHSAIGRVLRMPHKCFPVASAAHVRALNIPAPWPAGVDPRATRTAAAAPHRRQVEAAVAALRAARLRWAPLVALVDDKMHYDRQLWQADAIVEGCGRSTL